MMLAQPYTPPEVVPAHELQAWRTRQQQEWERLSATAPEVLVLFIEAVAQNMGTMEPSGRTRTPWRGAELKATAWAGSTQLDDADVVLVDFPVLNHVDHRLNMLRYYQRRGAKALIDWCRAHCNERSVEIVIAEFETKVLGLPMSTRDAKKLNPIIDGWKKNVVGS